jgi:hypothetical protein
LQVENGVGLGQAHAAQQRETGVGVDQGHFQSIVGGVVGVVEAEMGESEAQGAVVFSDDEDLVEARLRSGGFLEERRAVLEMDVRR